MSDFDQRMDAFMRGMDALKERHEALTARHEALTRRHEALAETVEYNQHQFALHEQLFGQIALCISETREAVDRLVTLAGLHQDRLDEHGQRLDHLEPH